MKQHATDGHWPEDLNSAYLVWKSQHARERKGDAKRRLADHGHAERMFLSQVWWPATGSLEGLYPEYEVKDYKDSWRYLDYAYLAAGFKVCIEIDGYGTHWRDTDRWQFADHLMRQNHLVLDGWIVLRFAYDDIMKRPRQCQQLVQQLLGKSSHSPTGSGLVIHPMERAIIKLSFGRPGYLRTEDMTAAFGIHRRTAAKYMKALVEKGFLLPVNPNGKRICRYMVNQAYREWGMI
ncbi:DNA-binding response regulator [Cohnella lubricantis]|uniref:DNA-binding response regulator n=1 Tax=Cohnella lubricantis TaxID=2163172 RepID=A0A841T4T5_9BACL|nr:DNA-binding response regulator [Cohnella lubricantis]MBB6676344.1 DNA-binding response regulator [Cohnella lubricantis]MBP2120286.1 hypothetical protein [Cohnella lubricantis]